jgi:hypothetical protein
MMTCRRVCAGVVLVAVALLSGGCREEDVHRVATRLGVTLTDTQARAVADWWARPRTVEDLIRGRWAGTGHADRAVRVARCESGLDPAARNGQYRGVFQMGRRDWARYGAGDIHDAAANVDAAYRYWLVAGWSPWSCRG